MDRGCFRRGTTTLLSYKLALYVLSFGIIIKTQVQFMILDINCIFKEILNIYASNSKSQEAQF